MRWYPGMAAWSGIIDGRTAGRPEDSVLIPWPPDRLDHYRELHRHDPAPAHRVRFTWRGDAVGLDLLPGAQRRGDFLDAFQRAILVDRALGRQAESDVTGRQHDLLQRHV